MKEAGIHPAKELLQLYKETPDRRDKIKIMLELLSYVAPKPREMIPLDEDDLGSMPLAELVKIIKTQLPELEKEAG